jgi:rRNA maturation RNase YbeY
MVNIFFHNEDIEFDLPNQPQVISWIDLSVQLNKATIEEVNYIFCSDTHLLGINKQYLKHGFFTDIITFDHSDSSDKLESDIFISIDRVKENAKGFNVPFITELHRVMIHGVLHLLGYSDKTDSDKEEMRKIEDHYLALRKF